MKLPNFAFEKKCWEKGFEIVIGIDEVGRGCFAGPVVVGAVAFGRIERIKSMGRIGETKGSSPNTPISPYSLISLGVNDSKLLKPRERERLAKEIKSCCLAYDITEVGVSVINKIGIGKATEKAMRKAVRDIVKLLDCYIVRLEEDKKGKNQCSNLAIQQSSNFFVLVDGFHVKYLHGIGLKNQKGIVHGDQKSISIAAASILAKVYRDKLMQGLSKQSKYKRYGWGNNKGYGTKEHQKAILKYGMCRLHRKVFVATWEENQKGEKRK